MERTHVLRARQIKAARALLDWSQENLAGMANLSIATIRKLELGHISPRGKTMQQLRHAFEDAGLEFIEPDGVRHRPEDIFIYQGREGYTEFFNDVYNTASRKECEIVFVSDSEIAFGFLGLQEYQQTYAERMTAIKNKSKVRCILTENNTPLWASDYIEYRFMSKHYVNSVPFYVYDDKYAAIMFEVDPSPKIIVIQSAAMSRAFRQQFHSMWEKAAPLNKAENSNEFLLKKAVRG